MTMSKLLLQNSKIGGIVQKLSLLDETKYPEIFHKAKVLVLKWKAACGCFEKAFEILEEYRKLRNSLEENGQKKPDMVAYKECRKRPRFAIFCGTQKHGMLKDIPIGITLNGRGEAAVLGIHTNILSGIDAKKEHSCFAVCLSGKYDDDESHEGEDGTIVYSGMGGQKGNHQVEDQAETVANLALIRSSTTGDPIRVLKRLGRSGTDYRYEGLYRCVGYDYGPSKDGPKVYNFILEPIPYQSTLCFRQEDPPLELRRGIGGVEEESHSSAFDM